MHLGRILMEELTHYIKNNRTISMNKSDDADLEQENGENSNKTDEIPVNLKHESKNVLKMQHNQQNQKENNNSIETSSASWKQFSTQLGQVFNISEPHLKPHNWKLIYSKEDVDYCIFHKILSYNLKRILSNGNLFQL
jgi:hypothetical protein